MQKQCPMFSAGNPGRQTACIGGGCAWWDDAAERCAFLSLAIAVDTMFMILAERIDPILTEVGKSDDATPMP